MSLQIIARLHCDSCGAMLELCPDKFTDMRIYSEVKRLGERLGWAIMFRRGKPKHLCDKCVEQDIRKSMLAMGFREAGDGEKQ